PDPGCGRMCFGAQADRPATGRADDVVGAPNQCRNGTALGPDRCDPGFPVVIRPEVLVKNSLTFGYLYDFRNPAPWRRPWAQLYAETLDFIRWSEGIGFDGAWVPEHHGADDG